MGDSERKESGNGSAASIYEIMQWGLTKIS